MNRDKVNNNRLIETENKRDHFESHGNDGEKPPQDINIDISVDLNEVGNAIFYEPITFEQFVNCYNVLNRVKQQVKIILLQIYKRYLSRILTRQFNRTFDRKEVPKFGQQLS